MNILTEFPQAYMCGMHRLLKAGYRCGSGLGVPSSENRYILQSPSLRLMYDPLIHIVLGKECTKKGVIYDISNWGQIPYAEYSTFASMLGGRSSDYTKVGSLTSSETSDLRTFAYYINSALSRAPYDMSYHYESCRLAKQFPEAHQKLLKVL